MPPILRLRENAESGKPEGERVSLLKFPDGPWRRHPDEIDDSSCSLSDAEFPLDINIKEYRIHHQEEMAAFLSDIRQWPKSERNERMDVQGVSIITQLVDMEHILETNEDNIERAIEQSFVYCDMYGVDINEDHMLTHLTVISNLG